MIDSLLSCPSEPGFVFLLSDTWFHTQTMLWGSHLLCKEWCNGLFGGVFKFLYILYKGMGLFTIQTLIMRMSIKCNWYKGVRLTLYMLNFLMKHSYLFVMFAIYWHWNCKWLKINITEDKDMPTLPSQYHACWWLVATRSQVISMLGFDPGHIDILSPPVGGVISFVPGRSTSKSLIFKLIMQKITIAPIWMQQNLTNEKSTLVQVVPCCTRPQLVNSAFPMPLNLFLQQCHTCLNGLYSVWSSMTVIRDLNWAGFGPMLAISSGFNAGCAS